MWQGAGYGVQGGHLGSGRVRRFDDMCAVSKSEHARRAEDSHPRVDSEAAARLG